MHLYPQAVHVSMYITYNMCVCMFYIYNVYIQYISKYQSIYHGLGYFNIALQKKIRDNKNECYPGTY